MTKRCYRREIEEALDGGVPEHMPFTVYNMYLPSSPFREELVEMGLSTCGRKLLVRELTPNVTVQTVTEPDGARRTIHKTPIGDLTSLSRPAACNSWAPVEHCIKSRDDFRVAEYIVRDRKFVRAYDEFLAFDKETGDSGYVITAAPYSPLIEMQLCWLGQEAFCYQMADNFDACMSLYDVICRSRREHYEMIVEGPARHINNCGNVVPEMLGMDNLRKYVLPCWKQFGRMVHAAGKKMGSHLDANNLLLVDMIREAELDFIEAFTPPPDCNLSVEQARRELPGKVLWINFPSGQHRCSDQRIREITLDILREAGDRRGVLFGITEDVPQEHLVRSFRTILRTLREFERKV